MIKKMITRKLLITSAVIFALSLIWLIPTNKNYTLKDIPQKLEYVNINTKNHEIYLLNKDNLLSRTNIAIDSTTNEDLAKELIEVLIKDGSGENKIPSGFKSFLPSDTKINSLKIEDDLIKINFSKELLTINEELEEKMVEAIIYTLTSIDKINKVIIYIDNNILTKLPNSKKLIPPTLTREFGINKVYDITSYKDINQVTIYYLDKYNDDYYYVPVTKYLNDNKEKIEIIIEELSSNSMYNTNLMSFLNSNAKLLSSSTSDDKLLLEFNEYIFNDMDNLEILEEVIYTICLSVKDNYDVKEVIFNVNNKQIYKSVLKTIE